MLKQLAEEVNNLGEKEAVAVANIMFEDPAFMESDSVLVIPEQEDGDEEGEEQIAIDISELSSRTIGKVITKIEHFKEKEDKKKEKKRKKKRRKEEKVLNL